MPCTEGQADAWTDGAGDSVQPDASDTGGGDNSADVESTSLDGPFTDDSAGPMDLDAHRTMTLLNRSSLRR